MAEYIINTTNMPDHILEVAAPWCNAEVIRCRDCRFYTDEPGLSEEKPESEYCAMYSDWDSEWNYDNYHYVEPDGFCKWGEVDPAGLTGAGSHHIEDDTTGVDDDHGE